MRAADADTAEAPGADDFARAVIGGLEAERRHIPCRFLYDARGSELFEEITRLDAYYPTRVEAGLLREHGGEIAERAGAGCAVVEFGSGSSRKTHVLLEHMEAPAAYVPIDIDVSALKQAAGRLRAAFPGLPLYPLEADFSAPVALPEALAGAPRLGFFPGSTIGNFEHEAAITFLADAGRLLGEGSALIVGADLRKDPAVLERAYDDPQGVTAAFTLNLLRRINRELEGSFDLAGFAHRALYNEAVGRIEIYLESLRDQSASVCGRRFSFPAGERIHVENSHKYTLPQFRTLAEAAGWRSAAVWTDARDYFSLHYLARPAA
ncbi:MAG: L-histidine N(alpha)-methyltransferase [Methyloligellaceae bacterium]